MFDVHLTLQPPAAPPAKTFSDAGAQTEADAKLTKNERAKLARYKQEVKNMKDEVEDLKKKIKAGKMDLREANERVDNLL